MAHVEPQPTRRPAALAIAAFGGFSLLIGAVLGPNEAVAGAAVFIAAAVLAMRELSTPTITWPNAIGGFALVIWLIPARGYRLPISLPFNLEPYRIVLAALVLALIVTVLRGRTRLEFLGFGAPLAILAGTATLSAVLNYESLSGAPGEGAFKSLSYYLGFLFVFVLVASTIKTHAAMDTAVRALVIGATIVAASAVYESRTGYNPFDHLAEWIPALIRESRTDFELRGGSLRAYASAQHPIALSAALFMTFPLALYLIGRAQTRLRARLWGVAAAVCAMGAVATISRTSVIMVLAILAVGLWVRGRQVVRFWPLLLVLPVAIHFAVPGALGGIYRAFDPQQGLTSDLTTRSGESGSGRLADIEPGLNVWSESPLYGNGIGTRVTSGEAGAAQTALGAEGAVIFFDNEWLSTLVQLGILGIVGTAWFVFGSLVTVGRFARRVRGPRSDLAAACAAAIGAFGLTMFVFDAFAFVQSTVIFFMVAAIGLQARRLGPRPTDS
ncbi:MAG: O-antigen ligase family protein [Gaiellaceae bacterium]